MAHRTNLSFIATAACMVVLAGCTTASQGQPIPQPTSPPETTMATSQPSAPRSTSTATSDLPTDGAPKVKNPLDTSRYQQNPCQMLTPSQLTELNLPAQGEQRQAPLGLACNWLNPDTGGRIGVQWGDKKPNGLSGTYAAHKAGTYAYFIEFPDIEGFPAVASDLVDGRDTGAAILEMGVTDRLTFQVGVGLSLRNIGQKDPVEAVVLAARMMVQTMKAGG